MQDGLHPFREDGLENTEEAETHRNLFSGQVWIWLGGVVVCLPGDAAHSPLCLCARPRKQGWENPLRWPAASYIPQAGQVVLEDWWAETQVWGLPSGFGSYGHPRRLSSRPVQTDWRGVWVNEEFLCLCENTLFFPLTSEGRGRGGAGEGAGASWAGPQGTS